MVFRNLVYSQQGLIELIEIWREIKKEPLVLRQLSEEKKVVIAGKAFQKDMLREMRSVKNKLKILKVLSESKCLSLAQYEELKSWILLWEQLP